jgi:hypothetical protein
MRTSCLFLAIALACAGVAGAQEVRAPPRLAKASYAAERKVLVVEVLEPTQVMESYVVRVPITVRREVDGKIVDDIQERHETRVRTVTKWMPHLIEHPLDQIEVRTTKPAKVPAEELPKLFAGEPRPVVLVKRTVQQVEGKPVVKIQGFNLDYMQLLKDNTLLVLLPPEPELPPLPVPAPAVPKPVE